MKNWGTRLVMIISLVGVTSWSFGQLNWSGLQKSLPGSTPPRSNNNGNLMNDIQEIKALAKPAIDEVDAMSINPAREDAFGQSVAASLLTMSDLVPDRPGMKVETYVTMVGLTVASASPNPGGNYVFGVLNRPDVNAFSGPNGYIFITVGALRQMQDEAELAGVLGHEIAHVCHHDGLHRLQVAAQEGALNDAMKLTNQTQRLAALTNLGVDIITKKGYDQPEENAADTASVDYIAAAGYDPRSYLRFLQRLQAKSGRSRQSSIMSTHPGIAERIGNVSAEIDRLNITGGATLADRFARRDVPAVAVP